jgi:branched-subunit amino acid transport protein
VSGGALLWAVILVVGLLNYLSRLSFIALFARVEMPPVLARALRFVPAAMLTAIVVPALVFPTPGVLALAPGNPKILAALVAAGVAWKFRSVTATMIAGMVALWVAKWLLAQAAGR